MIFLKSWLFKIRCGVIVWQIKNVAKHKIRLCVEYKKKEQWQIFIFQGPHFHDFTIEKSYFFETTIQLYCYMFNLIFEI